MMTDLEALLREREQRIADLRPGSSYHKRAAAWAEAFHAVAATAQGLALREVAALQSGCGWTEYRSSNATPEQRAIVTVAHQAGMDLLAPATIRAAEYFACHQSDVAQLIRLGYGDTFARQSVADKAIRLLRPRMDQVEELAERLVREGQISWPEDRGRRQPDDARAQRIQAGGRALTHAIDNGVTW